MKRQWIIPIILICVVTVAYVGVWRGGFIYDDTDIILRNPLVRGDFSLGKVLGSEYWETTRGKANYYRPLVILSYCLDFAL